MGRKSLGEEAHLSLFCPADLLKVLPLEKQALTEPYFYLSGSQRILCAARPLLAPYAPHLPAWVPQRKVAEVFNYPMSSIDKALEKLGGSSFVWAPEFQNRKSVWRSDDEILEVAGRKYQDAEAFFQAQKPVPFCKKLWDGVGPGLGLRDDVMRAAIRSKFSKDHKKLLKLLLSSSPHPLVYFKDDPYWGVLSDGTGENMLGRMLMEHRHEQLVLEKRSLFRSGFRKMSEVLDMIQKTRLPILSKVMELPSFYERDSTFIEETAADEEDSFGIAFASASSPEYKCVREYSL